MNMRSHPQTQPKSSFTPVKSGLLQRKCACGGSAGLTGKCTGCQKERLTVQRSAANQGENSEAPPIVHEVLRKPGQPLDKDTRGFMESRFGHNFSSVRVHTDGKAAQSAQAVNALAYTVGQDMVFGAGQYAPGTNAGKELLAHELTHTIQQNNDFESAVNHLEMTPPGDVAETEAKAVSKALLQGQTFTVRSQKVAGIFRQTLSEEEMTERGQRFASMQPPTREASSPPPSSIYMCSKNLERSPLGKHAFFRIGGSGKGNSTRSLEPVDRSGNCWQGEPMYDFPADVNADADCELIPISLSCLQSQFIAYPIGHYCTLGPNSNTFVGTLAKNCGLSNPDPSGWTPGINDSPPPSGTYAPSPDDTLFSCSQKICNASRELPPDEVPV